VAAYRPSLTVDQPAFDGFCAVTAAVSELANAGADARGAVFTRREVVDFILDLVGYTGDQDLVSKRLLEPAFGHGDFLLPAIERLLHAARTTKTEPIDLKHCIRAVELHRSSFDKTRTHLFDLLKNFEVSNDVASVLADHWLSHGDYLLTPIEGTFDAVVGNPPYVRQELIPDTLMMEYRSRYSTIYDRADLYVPFIERSLRLLSHGGELGFICADRWMKNRYGSKLRQLVSDGYCLKIYVDMVDTPAFASDVIAYPAITIIGRGAGEATRIARQPAIDAAALTSLAKTLRSETPGQQREFEEVAVGANGSAPWLLDANARLSIVRDLEARFPTLELAGCKVGIGVATGADDAFIGRFDELDVEPDRKLPLVMTRDIVDGDVKWRGLGVVNPFADEGGLVPLAAFPRLARYLEARRSQIAGRHCAQKVKANWYRTIDRITPSLAKKSKLLIPDIKGDAHIVFEPGELYPHHNLYFVTSDEWDLRALQAILLSDVARTFVSVYSTKMRGGYLRFQAQYLRRIRIPKWEHLSAAVIEALKSAAVTHNREACNRAAAEAYELSIAELNSLSEAANAA
jgi:hypothetical protein